MKRILMLVGSIGLLIGLTACFQHTYVVGSGAPEGEIVYKHWHHHWLFGLIRPGLQEELDVTEFCPSGDATIHEEVSFANGVVDVLIGIIYSPTTVTVRCADGAEEQVALDLSDLERISDDPRFLEFLAEAAPDRLDEARTVLAARSAAPETQEAERLAR